MSADDELIGALIPLAEELVTAVHALDAGRIESLFTRAAELSNGDWWMATRLLAVLCAAACLEDQPIDSTLSWTLDPEQYAQLCHDGVPALVASIRAGRTAPSVHPHEAADDGRKGAA